MIKIQLINKDNTLGDCIRFNPYGLTNSELINQITNRLAPHANKYYRIYRNNDGITNWYNSNK